MFYYLCLFHISETNYFKDGEEGVIVPNHVLAERGLQGDRVVSEAEEEGGVGFCGCGERESSCFEEGLILR